MDTEPKQDIRAAVYPCDTCPARSNRNCAYCLFSKENVEGIMNAFSPKGVQGDFSNSPLVQRVADSPAAQAAMLEKLDKDLHPRLSNLVVPSHNRIAEVLRQIEHK